ncbi:MAG TPA: NUDIX domain-containing protein [Gaiellales bacterium]|nr:NUDIX domain-containing protein [Gaiellales bacterium]
MIRAAGAVLHRDGLVAVVHRPQYDDWTLPKGKLDPGEDEREAAVREVEEETGHVGTVEGDLGTIGYDVAAGRKTVRFFLMAADTGGRALAQDVDEVRWIGLDEAVALVTYDRDREVLERARGLLFAR